MIEKLNGTYEEIQFTSDSHLKLHDNVQKENYPAHWHTSIEFVMPQQNIYTAVIDNEIIVLKPGDILVIWPGTVHSFKAPTSGRRFFFQAELSVLKDINEFNSVFSLMGPVSLFTPETTPELHLQLKRSLNEIINEYTTGNSLSEAAIYAQLISMLVLIGRNHIDKLNTDNFSNKAKHKEYINKFMNICEYIDEHFTEDLSLDQLAEMANFSKFHFARLFKQFANVSFYKYVNQKRIAYAETLLFNPNISITEVAIECGYSSPAAFIRMFKLIKDCTPTEFRKLSRAR